ncbi:PAAR domain-containing protein [Enterobacter cloacae]|uniref:PAAR domain-containing protein n=1 Tax=Enterobacter cloacae TaxID=550 RepID=UPI002A82D5DE|nr:PAAR domain-containing protein [Enterobacter cloacae]
MQQYTNEITPELRKSSSQEHYDEDFLASCDSKTREELEDFNKQVSRPLASIFRFAVVGSITRNGGVIRNASAGSPTGGYKMARVGDKVVYTDGSEATIVSGAGGARIIQDTSAALVGSMLDNGDEIISTPQSGSRLVFREGDTFPKGFLTMPGSKH